MVQRINGLIHESVDGDISGAAHDAAAAGEPTFIQFTELIIGAASEHETKTVTEICQSMGHMLRIAQNLAPLKPSRRR